MKETEEKGKKSSLEKKVYNTPKLLVHGDVDTITLGNKIGENLDAAFTTSRGGRKKPKKNPKFS